jgi:hypothetical protein
LISHEGNVWERGYGGVPKKFENFFFTKIKYDLYVLDRFDVLMLKIILKK